MLEVTQKVNKGLLNTFNIELNNTQSLHLRQAPMVGFRESLKM